MSRAMARSRPAPRDDLARPGWMTALQHACVYLSFLGLAAVYTWPLVTNLGGLLPPNGDPRLFSWVLLTIFGNLTTRPALLFHGNAFYPFGNTLSFAEPLLVPALVTGPLHAWTGNPVLAYNVTLLLFWALSGWAMYWVAWRVTGSRPAAFLAGMIFTFAPYRIDHYMEFQLEMAFGIPLAIYALVRFLETQRGRYLVALVATFWIQAASVWYYAIILSLEKISALARPDNSPPAPAAGSWRGPGPAGRTRLGGQSYGTLLFMRSP